MKEPVRQAAQNQHYVPKFILRNFLADPDKEQVSVFRKSDRRGFTTSIDNIMAERRFHEFEIEEDLIASFEESVGKIESALLSWYRAVLENGRLSGSTEERAGLALFVAFQMLRTRSQRDQFARLEEQLGEKLAQSGGRIEDLEGYEPLTEDRLKMQHVHFMRDAIGEFAQIIAGKDFLLLEAPAGRSFYLSDNPVCLYNSEEPHPFYGNVGLAVRGIEIYLPLSSRLMLAAFCPTILGDMRASVREAETRSGQMCLANLREGKITGEVMKSHMDSIKEVLRPPRELIAATETGTALQMNDANMDFSNSLQMLYARDFVICARGEFGLARRFMDETPDARSGVFSFE